MTEIRIAAVMNGGISLAVWMGGVTHELDRVRLASGGREPADERERAVHRAWTAVLEHAGRTVVVDTVAGTSAGGLNGTLLATAIAHGGHLGSLRDVWLSKASLERDKLLRADPEGAPTLLDGTYFTDCINGALADVAGSGGGDQGESGGEVTLLVTATAIGAPTPTLRLEGGREDSYRDSRRVFRFRRRLGRDGGPDDNDLLAPDPETLPSGEPSGPLARAARASASFPVAFEPVMEVASLREQRVSPPRGDDDQDLPLMDGGVLDNAPLGLGFLDRSCILRRMNPPFAALGQLGAARECSIWSAAPAWQGNLARPIDCALHEGRTTSNILVQDGVQALVISVFPVKVPGDENGTQIEGVGLVVHGQTDRHHG